MNNIENFLQNITTKAKDEIIIFILDDNNKFLLIDRINMIKNSIESFSPLFVEGRK